jgi:type I restriction enzyme S subunit
MDQAQHNAIVSFIWSVADDVLGHIDSFMFDGEYLTWITGGAHSGTMFRRSGRFSCTNVCGTLCPRGLLDLDFMRMAVASETKRVVHSDINPKLMNNIMARIRVSVPPFDEQVQIAHQVKQVIEPSELDIKR